MHFVQKLKHIFGVGRETAQIWRKTEGASEENMLDQQTLLFLTTPTYDLIFFT